MSRFGVMAQLCVEAALTCRNVPAGGVAWLRSLFPQQAIAPSDLTAQVCM